MLNVEVQCERHAVTDEIESMVQPYFEKRTDSHPPPSPQDNVYIFMLISPTNKKYHDFDFLYIMQNMYHNSIKPGQLGFQK